MMHRRLFSVLAVLIVCSGCRKIPFRVQTCGPIGVKTVAPIRVEASPICVNTGNPVQVETVGPLEVKASPVTVSAGMTPTTKAFLEEVVVREGTSLNDRIAIVELDGLLVNENEGGPLSAAENPVALFREKLDHIASDNTIRAVVLRINSPGGGVTASDIMRRDLRQFQDRTNIPVVACTMDVGAGGAYYIATAANEIYAHPTSLVGGIGVILNLYNLETALETFNIVGIPVKAGKKVDLGSPLRPLPDENRALLQGIADEFHDRFISMVKQSRGPMLDENQPFDGRVVTAEQALGLQLIDSVGYLDDAIIRASELGNCSDASVVLLNRKPDDAKTQYDRESASSISLLPSIPGLDRSKLPTFLYIWQPDPSLTSGIGS